MVDSAPPIAVPARSQQAPLRLCETAAMADHPMDTTVTDHLLSTTRAVRKRLDLDRPVEREVLLECLRLAVQSPTGSNSQNWHWMVVTDPDKRVRLKELYDGMARPYLESQAENADGSPDQAGVPVGRLPAEHPRPRPGARDPVRRGPAREPESRSAAASFYGSILPAVWSFMLAARSRGLGTGVDHAAPRATRRRPPSCSASPTA